MKLRTAIFLALAFSPLTLTIRSHAAAESADRVSIKGTMILASNSPGKSDPRLRPYESKLRRLFKFEQYRFLGEGQSMVAIPGETSLSLGGGFRLEVQASAAGKGRIRAQVGWTRGKTRLIRTTVVMQKGTPTILGGPAHEGGNLIVILTAR
jgi:hypothetical protein